MADYTRPASSERFTFNGVKTNSSPDALPTGKYAYASNVRGYSDSTTHSRPQIAQQVAPPPSGPVALSPRFTPGVWGSLLGSSSPVLALDASTGVYKIGAGIFYSGTQIDSGYAGNLGCSILPYRPDASVSAWDYIFDPQQSRKVLTSPLTVQNAGIAEPQSPPQVSMNKMNVLNYTDGTWVGGGTAGAITLVTRTTDTLGACFGDPDYPGYPAISPRLYAQVSSTQAYSPWMSVFFTDLGFGAIVESVQPALNPSGYLNIQGIRYYSGTTGRCTIVPYQTSVGSGVSKGAGSPVRNADTIASLTRGSIVQLGSEKVLVLSVATGPDGTLSFETSTTTHHVVGEVITGIPALTLVTDFGPAAGYVGKAITSNAFQDSATAGIATYTHSLADGGGLNPFTYPAELLANQPTAQPDDYIHISLQFSNADRPQDIRLLFDVDDGTFTKNYYYYGIRPSDIAAALTATANMPSQIAVAQIAEQRTLIDEESSAKGAAFPSSVPMFPGNGVWAEISFKVSDLIRVGQDESKSLATYNGTQLLVNLSDTSSVALSSLWVSQGDQPDIGDGEVEPYFYCYRFRSSLTGARSNRSPVVRFGVRPRRQSVYCTPSGLTVDPQVDRVDWYRMGGPLESFTFVGTSNIGDPYFLDNFTDTAIEIDNLLETDNYQPWPTIWTPMVVPGCTVTGTNVIIPALGISQEAFMLPGNLLQIGQQVYTLYTRPTFIIGQGIWMQIVEDAGVQSGVTVSCYEPALAAQPKPYAWGPDAQGSFFAVGDFYRPGLVAWTNPNNPDSASDANTKDLCAPTEPLQNGALIDGTSFVASPARWWQAYPQGAGAPTPYSWVECPVGAGLAAPFGICSDGERIYFVADDGIRAHSGGPSKSLTDADLYNLFPHEGIDGVDQTYAGMTIPAPDYTYAASMRLAVVNNYLYFDYLDSTQTYRTLVCDLREGREAWVLDTYTPAASIHAGDTSPASNNNDPASAERYIPLWLGMVDGSLQQEVTVPDPAGESVAWALATREDTVGDLRSRKLWGDAIVDALAAGGNVNVVARSYGSSLATTTVITGGQTSRPQIPYTVSLAGEVLARSLGLTLTGTDRGPRTVLYAWQPSYLTQPEDTTDRFSDWTDGGSPGLKFWQGFLLECDTANVAKSLVIRDSDTGTTHDFDSATGTNTVTHNGQVQKAYSFVQPFLAHLVRYEATVTPPWRVFGITYVSQPAPEFVLQWIGQATSFGLPGWLHVLEALVPYNAPAPLTWKWTVDGTDYTYTVPASTGYQKVRVPFGPVKGLSWTPSVTSTAPFQIDASNIEVKVKAWGSAGAYTRQTNLGGPQGNEVRI